jgi:hypothetical protein
MGLLLISINTFLALGAFLLIVIGFHTSQWAVYNVNCGCDNSCVFFIGLFKAKYTKLGKCGYKIKEVDCNDFNLNDDNCNYYESARDASQLTLALVVLLLVWKVVVSVLTFKFLESRKRIIWVLFLLATIGDIIIGFTAFITVGQFAEIDDWNIVNTNTGKTIHFDEGFGWNCFIGGGLVAWAAAILGGYTLWKGFTIAESNPAAEPAIPTDGNTK